MCRSPTRGAVNDKETQQKTEVLLCLGEPL